MQIIHEIYDFAILDIIANNFVKTYRNHTFYLAY